MEYLESTYQGCPSSWSNNYHHQVNHIGQESPLSLFSPNLLTERMYTDASKTQNDSAFGIIIANNTEIIQIMNGALPRHCTVFQSEGMAILQAPRWEKK